MCTPADVIPPANLQELELYLKAVMDERKLNISEEAPSNLAAAILTEFFREHAPQESVCFVTDMELLGPNFTFSLFSRLFTNGIVFLPCGHSYHQACISEWRAGSKSMECPECRKLS